VISLYLKFYYTALTTSLIYIMQCVFPQHVTRYVVAISIRLNTRLWTSLAIKYCWNQGWYFSGRDSPTVLS